MCIRDRLYKAHLLVLNTLHSAIVNEVMYLIQTQIRNIASVIISRHIKKFYKLYREQHKQDNVECKHIFYKRVANLTNIELSTEEQNLLSKGLHYNLPDFSKHALTREVTNAEATIKCIKNQDTQCETRSLINNKLNRLLKLNSCLLYTSRCV